MTDVSEEFLAMRKQWESSRPVYALFGRFSVCVGWSDKYDTAYLRLW